MSACRWLVWIRKAEPSKEIALATKKKPTYIFTKGSCFGLMRHQKMISLCEKSLRIAEQKPNFSMWVRSMLFAESEEFHANGLRKGNKIKYVCSECDAWIKTTEKRTDGAPHASRFFPANFRSEECNGILEKVIE